MTLIKNRYNYPPNRKEVNGKRLYATTEMQ